MIPQSAFVSVLKAKDNKEEEPDYIFTSRSALEVASTAIPLRCLPCGQSRHGFRPFKGKCCCTGKDSKTLVHLSRGRTPSSLDERDSPQCSSVSANILHFAPTRDFHGRQSRRRFPAKGSSHRCSWHNRISSGVQSSMKGAEILGRSHDSKQAFNALDMIRSRGFANVGWISCNGLETRVCGDGRKRLTGSSNSGRTYFMLPVDL